jgi:hypothetical protein
MKTLTSLLATSALLISATTANAYDFEQFEKNVLTTETTSSRADAYKLGVNKLTQLKSASPSQLFNDLELFSPEANVNSTKLEDTSYVFVQERMDANGKVGFVGIVNADVTYKENRDRHND